MSDPTIPPDPFETTADMDLVPGDPPVPITVWRTPAADPPGGMSPRLAARLLAAYSRHGDPVYDATADPVLAQAVTATGRRPAIGQPGEPVALVLTGWSPPSDGIDPVIALGALRRRLRPAGVLVAMVANPAPGDTPFDAGSLVHAARQARLSYLQHIVAVTAPVDGDHITPPPAADPSTQPRGGRHLRVHTDLLVFTRAGDRHA